MYLTKEMITNTILKIDAFKENLESLYKEYDIDINENTGRRNALISAIQEKVLSEQLAYTYTGVINDGAPGMPDIVIGEIDTELECKLTSGSGKKSRSYSLQTDYATICNKGNLDYIYFITNKDMTGYCAIYFENLTPEDFYVPPETARGKAKMNKKIAMKKATPVVGSIKNINQEHSKNYYQKSKDAEQELSQFEKLHLYDLESFVTSAKVDRFISKMNRENDRLLRKIQKNEEKAGLWEEKDPSFSFVFESLEDLKKEKKWK